MTIEELRIRIDELDCQLVELLSERARVVQKIGQVKASSSLPVYEPNREQTIYSNIRAANKGPLPDIELTHIYERIIDVMRALQRNELASEINARAARISGEQGHGIMCPSAEGSHAGVDKLSERIAPRHILAFYDCSIARSSS